MPSAPNPTLKGFRLVPWVLGSFERTLGDYMGSYKGYIRAIVGKPFKGKTLGVQARNP